MFSSMPEIFIFFRTFKNQLIKVFPMYIFDMFSDDFKIELLNNDYYFDLILRSIMMESRNVFSNKTGSYEKQLEFVLSVADTLSIEKQRKIHELLSSLEHK
jgi:hypothetical protein